MFGNSCYVSSSQYFSSKRYAYGILFQDGYWNDFFKFSEEYCVCAIHEFLFLKKTKVHLVTKVRQKLRKKIWLTFVMKIKTFSTF